MSYDARQWVRRHSQAKKTALTLLAFLADDVGKEGVTWRSYSMDELAEQTRTCTRQAQYNVAWLVEKGELRVQKGNGRSHKSIYVIAAIADGWRAEKGASVDTERVQVETVKGASVDTERVQVSTERVQVEAIKGASVDSGNAFRSLLTTTTNNKQQPPPPAAPETENGGGGGDILSGDLEVAALLDELTNITGRPPTNHERAVLSVVEYGKHRNDALSELRQDWPAIRQRNQVGYWLKRVIERLIVERGARDPGRYTTQAEYDYDAVLLSRVSEQSATPPAEPHELLWQRTKKELELQLASSTYTTWILSTNAVALTEDRLTVVAHNVFAQDWLKNRLQTVCERTLKSIAGREMAIDFILRDSSADAQRIAAWM